MVAGQGALVERLEHQVVVILAAVAVAEAERQMQVRQAVQAS